MSDLQIIWDEFLSRWPIDTISKLTIDEYTDVNNKDTLAYWLEQKTSAIGSIAGGSSEKFGIYKRSKNEPNSSSYMLNDDIYSWHKKYGATSAEAFNTIRSRLEEVITAIKSDNLTAIESIDLGNTLKWKIAFFYQDQSKPRVLNIFSLDMLRKACNQTASNHAEIYDQLVKSIGDRHIVEYGKEIWNKLEKKTNISGKSTVIDNNRLSLNSILYGPPGTGKTYSTINKALEILDPEYLDTHKDNRGQLKARFDELSTNNHIGFVTFHQSFSYEDFVEGLKADTGIDGAIRYEVEDGVLKTLIQSPHISYPYDPNKTIWQISTSPLDYGLIQEIDVESFKNENILYIKDDIDIAETNIKTARSLKILYGKKSSKFKSGPYSIFPDEIFRFSREIEVGDLVAITYDTDNILIGIVKSSHSYNKYKKRHERNISWLNLDKHHKKALSNIFTKVNQRIIKFELDFKIKEELTKLLPQEKNKVLIIDEINRGNIANIFGELITLIEPTKRSGAPEALTVKLPYSKQPFSVPSNLYLIGTMNTADKSLSQLDIALRRRFDFIEMMPNYDALRDIPEIEGINIARLLETLNQRLEILYDREHTIGHSFFLPLIKNNKNTINQLARIFELQILPLLEEYFFEDWERVGQVLGDHLKIAPELRFVKEKFDPNLVNRLMGNDWDMTGPVRYERNLAALLNPQAYIGIYEEL